MVQAKNNREASRNRISAVAILVIAFASLIGVYSWTNVVAVALDQSNLESIESSPFQLVSTQPQANALDISPTLVISATFNEAVDATTVSTATFTVRGSLSGIYTGIYTVTGSTIEFKASDAFKAGELIATTVTSDVQSIGGNQLEPHYTWEFYISVGSITELGQGMFDERILPESGGNGTGVALGDLDSDGDLDAFEAGDSDGKVWFNDGIGNFVDSGQRFGPFYNDVALGDLDGDGDLDAVLARSSLSTTVYFNDGIGTFTNNGQDFGEADHIGVALGDLDGDGDLDVFLTDNFSGATAWINDGGGVFTDSGQILGDLHSTKASLGDVDADGDLDALVVSAWNDPTKLWLNDGQGIFSDSSQDFGGRAFDIVLGDLDDDGDLDAIVAGEDSVWFNDGSGVYSSGGQSLGGSDLALADLDGDGDLDVIVIYPEDKVFHNDGAGNFSHNGQNLGSLNGSHGIAPGDLDNDGDVDAFVVRTFDEANLVYVNRNRLVNHVFMPRIGDDACRDYFDDFSDDSSGWPQINDPFVLAGYWNEMYLVHSKQSGFIYLFEAPDCDHQYYLVEAEIRWSEDHLEGSSYGLIFGVSGDFDSYYLFDISPRNQQYRLLRRDSSGFSVVVPITFSSAINGVTYWNTLRAYLTGDLITLEINGETLGAWPVPEIVGSSGSGIASTPYSNQPNSRALFDNFKIINTQNSSPTASQNWIEQDSGSGYSMDSRIVDLGIPSWQSMAMHTDMAED